LTWVNVPASERRFSALTISKIFHIPVAAALKQRHDWRNSPVATCRTVARPPIHSAMPTHYVPRQ
jgi:hypothetical protein